MINLLPVNQKQQLLAARGNTLIARYVVLLFIVLLFLLGSIGFTFYFLTSSGNQADAQKAENEAQASGYTTVQSEATALRSEIAAAQQLFSSEVRYSLALLRISELLPAETALEELELTEQSFGQPLVLTVLISGESAANSLRQSFQSSPHFSSVEFGSLIINEGNAQYPYTIELHATMNRSIAQ